MLLFLLFIAILPFQGCSTLSNGRVWGHDTTLTPGWERVKESAINASMSPETWGPIAGAIALQIDNADQRISDWASKNPLIFKDKENARDWGHYLEDASVAVYFITVLATPGGDDNSDWLTSKAKGLAIGASASIVTGVNTSIFKKVVGRTRPDGSNDKSFPSGHESGTATFTTLARRNLDSINMSQSERIIANIGIIGLDVGTGWARVEAKKHYPSDVLAGYALGHFISSFINDAFLGLDNDKAPRISVERSRKEMCFGLTWSFH